jgi:hypothetical protein
MSSPVESDSATPESDAPAVRRKSFRRRGDYLALTLIVVVAVAVALTVWWTSDVRATTSQTSVGAPTPPPATAFPPSLAEVWHQPSAATPEPVAVGPSVVTGDGHHVVGRDPLTGTQRWSYDRKNLSLCTVSQAFSKVLAFYRKGNWCSEVTSLDPATGKRGAQRNGDAELGMRALEDGVSMTTTGPTLLTTTRSDLVQTMEYGKVPDYVNAERQPRSGCTYGSVAMARPSADKIGVVERCGPKSSSPSANDRFTVYGTTNTDSDKPKVAYSVLLPGKNARVVAMNGDYAAVALPNPSRLLVLDQSNGKIVAQYGIDVPAKDFDGDPPGRAVPITNGDYATYWYTGSSVLALSVNDFRPKGTVPGALGAGTSFAGRAVFPVPEGVAVLDAQTGKRLATVKLDRHGYRGPIAMSSIGQVLLEQRGRELVALR